MNDIPEKIVVIINKIEKKRKYDKIRQKVLVDGFKNKYPHCKW